MIIGSHHSKPSSALVLWQIQIGTAKGKLRQISDRGELNSFLAEMFLQSVGVCDVGCPFDFSLTLPKVYLAHRLAVDAQWPSAVPYSQRRRYLCTMTVYPRAGGCWLHCLFCLSCQAEVRPKCGRLVAFSSGKENPHGVWAVSRGRRCAIALWYTQSQEHAEQVKDCAGETGQSISKLDQMPLRNGL